MQSITSDVLEFDLERACCDLVVGRKLHRFADHVVRATRRAAWTFWVNLLPEKSLMLMIQVGVFSIERSLAAGRGFDIRLLTTIILGMFTIIEDICETTADVRHAWRLAKYVQEEIYYDRTLQRRINSSVHMTDAKLAQRPRDLFKSDRRHRKMMIAGLAVLSFVWFRALFALVGAFVCKSGISRLMPPECV